MVLLVGWCICVASVMSTVEKIFFSIVCQAQKLMKEKRGVPKMRTSGLFLLPLFIVMEAGTATHTQRQLFRRCIVNVGLVNYVIDLTCTSHL